MRSLALPLITAAATFALANALAEHDWLIASAALVVVAVGIWAIAPRGAPALSQVEPASSLAPTGFDHTIAQGE